MKVGGQLSNSFHIRNNPSFQNNATGLEVFSTLFASGKLSWNISNKEKKRAKFLFIPMNFKPRKRELSFRVNLAVMNNTYRNGYAYNNNSAITNDPDVFDDYQLKIFSGYRLGTECELHRFSRKTRMPFDWDMNLMPIKPEEILTSSRWQTTN